jgi:hypothetical protein
VAYYRGYKKGSYKRTVMNILLVGLDEDSKNAIADELVAQYGFTNEAIYRPFKGDVVRSIAQTAEELSIKPVAMFGAIETTLRQAFGPTPFITALARRIDSVERGERLDYVVSDVIYADEVEALQKLGFHAIIVTSTNRMKEDQSQLLTWHARIQWAGAVINEGTLGELKQKTNALVLAVAQREGAASLNVRAGLNSFRG